MSCDKNAKILEFLKKKLKEYEVFSTEHPDSNKEHINHKNNVLIPQIKRAIVKCKEGTRTICDDCGEEISKERLKILPTAIRCVNCQEVFENNGKPVMDKEEIKEFLLNTLGHYSAITVNSWLKEPTPTRKKIYKTAFENWSKAVSVIIEKLEGKDEKKIFDKLTQKEKIADFKNSDFSFKIFYIAVKEVFIKRTAA